jgi:hypothetical protein
LLSRITATIAIIATTGYGNTGGPIKPAVLFL